MDVSGFGDAVTVEHDAVTWFQLHVNTVHKIANICRQTQRKTQVEGVYGVDVAVLAKNEQGFVLTAYL